jgi:hypothetical protein
VAGNPNQQQHDTLSQSQQSSRRVHNNHTGAERAAQTVVIATANVPVLDYDGVTVMLRALLDSGSQSSFFSEIGFKKLKSQRLRCDTRVTGLGAEKSHRVHGEANIQIRTSESSKVLSVRALIMPTITGILPSCAIDVSDLNSLTMLELADENFHIPARVDLLLGADVFLDIVKPGETIMRDGIKLIKTIFGWAVSGPIQQPGDASQAMYAVTSSPVTDDYNKFWELEEIPGLKFSARNNLQFLTKEERYAEEFYDKTTKVMADGRITVALPFRADSPNLGHTKPQAERRMVNVFEKLRRSPDLQKKFEYEFMQFYNLGHMEIVPHEQMAIPVEQSCYTPHHCVFKELSTTTKLRVVFDGSAKSSTGVSLNGILAVGLKLQEDLQPILLRL